MDFLIYFLSDLAVLIIGQPRHLEVFLVFVVLFVDFGA